MRRITAVLALGMIGSSACADQPASSVEPRPAPVVLTGELRKQVGSSLDVNAVESYLGTMDASAGRRVLEGMGFFPGTPPRETRDVAVPVSSADARRQELLARVWRSYAGPFQPALLPLVAPPRPDGNGAP